MRRWITLVEALEPAYHEPLTRIVGQDFPDTFYHGTARRNIKTLAADRPDDSTKGTGGERLFDFLFPPEVNEFGAELFLSEPRQPQQAHMFSQGRGNALAVVRLKPGTRILDVSDELARAPNIGFGGPEILRFFHRPAITDDMIAFQLGRIYPGYKERHPDWQKLITARMEPTSSEFTVQSWQDVLVPYARARGYDAIRFADEILLVNRSAIRDVRVARPKERDAAASTRTYRGSSGASLFTDQPTGAHDEYEEYKKKGASPPSF